jgi:hypothetical protein
MKRASDDVGLRPFASQLFDAQAYVRGVLSSDRRSEEVLGEVGRHSTAVDEDIGRYITQNRRELVGGMQDVTALAEKYSSLRAVSENLRRVATKSRAEAQEALETVESKTTELERIHDTSVALRQLRQFVHVKGQLEHSLQAAGRGLDARDLDIRQLAAAARVLGDLESLMTLPRLASVKCVAESAGAIKALGQYVRSSSQAVLLTALRDQDQATLSSALQVFFHLRMLPEVTLLAVDDLVRLVAELVKEVVDVGALSQQSELGGGKASKPTAGVKKEGTGPQHLRALLSELSAQFDSILYEYSMRVSALHQLLTHKEDPASRARYIGALQSAPQSSAFARHRGNLVRLFWDRLAEALREVFSDKLRAHSAATVRLYPSLRRAAVEVTEAVEASVLARDASSGSRQFADSTSMMELGAGDVFGSRVVASSMRGLSGPAGRAGEAGERASSAAAAREAAGGGGGVRADDEGQGLLPGLGACRDRYLLETQSRMAAPVSWVTTTALHVLG